MVRKIFNLLFYRSWWVVAFTLLCGVLYENGLKIREVHYQQLKDQSNRLQIEKQRSLELQKNLKLRINSQTDSAWKELVLMRILGLVPENERKVFFYKDE